jgi:hypothetical protein
LSPSGRAAEALALQGLQLRPQRSCGESQRQPSRRRPVGVRTSPHSEELPFAVETLEAMGSVIRKRELRSRHKIQHRSGCEDLVSVSPWEPSWEPSVVDAREPLWTPTDSEPFRSGVCGLPWTPVDTAWRSTDQKVGGSSPSGRATRNPW